MKLNIVPPRTGLSWVRLGIQTFARQPLALSALFFMYMAAVLLISTIPVVGMVVGSMLVPAATLGLMAASEQASRGKFPLPSVLVSAFRAGRQRARAMLVLGVIYTLGSVLATFLASLIVGPRVMESTEPDPAMLVVPALHIPLFLMFWHAPALVHWHGVAPVKSLFFSVVACLRNFSAFLVYGLGWLGIFLAAGLTFGMLGGLVGGAAVARAVLTPVALLVTVMFSTSIYFTFRDSFVASEPVNGESP